MLDEQISRELREYHAQRINAGSLPTEERLKALYATFRERFGPERLANMDGEALLSTMHEHGNYDSLVYWLEFKDDQEFPNIFGSIAGGSALKFGIYRRKETGQWMTGSPQKQIVLTTEQAVERARRHRDQLVRGVELLSALPVGADDAAYNALQQAMAAEAPLVQNTAWGHKYFSLLAPDKLDDYHNPDYQRFHLIKMRQRPPAGEGRYLCAGRFVAIAAELGIPLNHLTSMLNELDGEPHKYWRVNVSEAGDSASAWASMLDGGYIAIGWGELGDLHGLEGNQKSKDQLKALVAQKYGPASGSVVAPVFNFVTRMWRGSVVVAASGSKMLAIGRVKGVYAFDETAPAGFPHRRAVEWLHVGEFHLPVNEDPAGSVGLLGKSADNLLAIEEKLARPVTPTKKQPTELPKPPGKHNTPIFEGIAGRIQGVLERKGQIILYGPPGTGKTHWAELAARDLAAYATFGAAFEGLSEPQRAEVIGTPASPGLVRMCTFHPAYGYEDFLEGYRPSGAGAFELRPGIFKRLCQDASAQPKHRFYLIIDEINRGDIPRIFGELLTVLEKNKRGRPVVLPLSGEPFVIPSNVYVIGTMNTADRSIALLDTALRRRFGFVELMPDTLLLGKTTLDGIPIGPWLKVLNERILEHIGRDARNLQIGHSYLMDGGHSLSDFTRFARVVQEDILPLLEEYCYEDYEVLEKILGSSLVDKKRRQIKHELFEPGRSTDLIAALLKIDPLLATSQDVVAAEPPEPNGDEIASEDEG